MFAPRVDRFDRQGQPLSSEKDVFFCANEDTRKELDHQLVINSLSARLGLRTLQSFFVKKVEPLKQEKFNLSTNFIDGSLIASEKVNEEKAIDVDSGSQSIVNTSNPLREEIKNEEMLLRSDPELKGFFKGLRTLETLYDENIKFFDQFGVIQGVALTGFEYGSANKDNIHGIASKINPNKCDEIERSLDTVDSRFKEINCLIPFIMHGLRYLMIFYVQIQMERYRQQTKEVNGNAGSQELSAYSNSVKIIQKCIGQFEERLEQDKKEIQEDLRQRKAKILKAFSPIISWPIKLWLKCSPKSASKLVKHSVAIIATSYGIKQILNAHAFQQEWISRLQPNFAVNVYSNSAIAEELIFEEMETTQQEIVKEINEFLSFLRNCDNIEEVEDKFEEIGIPFEGPRTIHEFQDQLERSGRFVRFIVQSYYYYKGHGQMILNDSDFKLILSKKQEEYNCKVEACLVHDIEKLIDACQNEELAYTKDYFKQRHIDIDSIELSDDELVLPPQTEADWQQCIQNEEFCRALAKQLLNYHEALGISADLAIRQTMLSKHAVENESLIFRGVGNAVEFLSSVVQIGLLCNQVGVLKISQQVSQSFIFLSASSALEVFLKDISKSGVPGIGIVSICYPLYPNVSLKLESLFLLLAEHFVNVKHKPNEYSLEGYMLAVQMNTVQFAIKWQTLIFFCKQSLLWLNIRLVENCIMHLKNKPFNEDPRFVHMDEHYRKQTAKYKYYIQDLKEKVNNLKIKDAELVMCPQLEKVRANLKNLQPLKDIAEKLGDPINVNFFPNHIIESIEDATGFRLTNSNKHRFREHMEKLLTSSEADFIDIYKSYRVPHMKA